MGDDEKVLLGRVAGGLEALARDHAAFREETKSQLTSIGTKLDAHGTELAELRGARRSISRRRMAAIATVAAAAITGLANLLSPFAKAVAASIAAALPGR